MSKRIFFTVVVILTLFICGFNILHNDKAAEYNFNKPSIAHTLPAILHEVSGITYLNSNSIACVQDEKGIVFMYDFVQGRIIREFSFGEDGDYEGITKVGNKLYVLRSDGTLFEISEYESSNYKVKSYTTGIPAEDNEGLCYDQLNNRLLIACKSKIGKGSEYKDKRAIYSFDLKTKKLSKSPVFNFDLNIIYRFMEENAITVPTKSKKKSGKIESSLKFRTSAIAIHPISKKLYLLSAADYLLFIFNMDGSVEQIEKLNPVRFNKAEGITFLENGDMLISNEGESADPTLLLFNNKNNN